MTEHMKKNNTPKINNEHVSSWSHDRVFSANMATEDLPSEFDIVILGTGLVESVVAAACSRVGQRVLHLDRRSYYAANWASFTFNGLLTWIQEQNEEPKPEEVRDWSGIREEGEELIHLSQADSTSITNLQVFSYASEEEEEEEEEEAANSTEEERVADEEAVKESSETESADSKEEEEEEEGAGEEEEQPIQAKGKEPEADQPGPSSPGQSEPSRKKISYAQLVKEGRRFNIDLVSKLLFSRGSLVDLLIKSNVSRYAEFKNITRILTYRHGNIEQVPCSRADVFASRQLSVVEKRKLMRFLTSCVEETEEQTAYHGRPYLEFLQDQQLGDNLQHFLLHSIAMVAEDTPTEEGLASTRHFLRSLGRYGNTPFLFPVYGLGEIPQCFCRMSAVFGGIYCLRHSVHCLIVDRDAHSCKAVIDSRGQRISCSHVVMEASYLDRSRMATPPRFLSRAVLITDSSVLPSESNQQISMVTVPPEGGSPAVKIVELSPSSMTCIPGTYLVHLTCRSVGSAHQDLSPLVTRMFRTTETREEDQRPSVLWSLYFNMVDGMESSVEGLPLPSNVHICHGPDSALGHEDAVQQAASIFQRILPEEEFCPPAPNPEDIVYDGDNMSTGEDRGDMGQDDEQHPEQNQNQENPDAEQNQENLDAGQNQNQENRNQNQENLDAGQNQNQENRNQNQENLDAGQNQNQENPDPEQNQNHGNPELQSVGPEERPSSS
ncbi:rab proteins geranylgeranyltransferase component A 1 [Poeciliopsis prolifica]|uniref:rab proteins geranylgeranyltransferase component A 1 n=1 Tax=Poeciliopsis prolifica TaxID=188132 RepID=UPI002413569B|nr:rab proteins geranylgeranyltransferase component A 1 [Poeciliopsis prolifica]